MQQGVQLHYQRCHLFHVCEQLIAAAIDSETAILVQSPSREKNSALIASSVIQQIKAISQKLYDLQDEVLEYRTEVLKEANKSGCFFSTSSSSSYHDFSAVIKLANRFIEFVQYIQIEERAHLPLVLEIAEGVIKHLSKRNLRGSQCEACLLEVKNEWTVYATERATRREAERRKQFYEEMKSLASQHHLNCGHSEENGGDGEGKKSTQTGPLLVLPIPPDRRSCPHFSLHDSHNCIAHRLYSRWREPLHSTIRMNGLETIPTSLTAGPIVCEEQEALKLRQMREQYNPWATRIRSVDCRELFMGEDGSPVPHNRSARYTSPDRISGENSSKDTNDECPFVLSLSKTEKRIYPLGEEQVGEKEDHEEDMLRQEKERLRQPVKTSKQSIRSMEGDRMHQSPLSSKKENEDDFMSYSRAIATFNPDFILQGCMSSAWSLHAAVQERNNMESRISDLVEMLKSELEEEEGFLIQ